ncbi:MAG: SLOG family protein [Clostridia bacterium]
MQNKEKSVAFTGHRAEQLPKGVEMLLLKKRLKKEIQKCIENGYNCFYQGGSYGWDLLCASAVIEVKEKLQSQIKTFALTGSGDFLNIKLISVVPFKDQAKNFTEKEKAIYNEILEKSNEVITLSSDYHKNCYKDRNQYMVDHSAKLIAYWNGAYRSGTAQTVRMAEKQNIEIVNLYK